MTTMVERVAGAIIAELNRAGVFEIGWSGDLDATPAARAAIEAMREPSPAMWDAAQENALPPGWLSDWQSLISAALAEDEVTG
jgi:hypothetical protein